ncbi:hypothetical protein METHB2_110013 [Candidatus Methylobacter favarea]|uniref:Uncharacterized protein n=1 Tax=Candidatus Methylobacter favarea TaxID=2707345 RepID=A0A8S0W8V5_9GAMM|nr:hypothetical protein METHB2_110013 [Candidatus Methylobacter favarea]
MTITQKPLCQLKVIGIQGRYGITDDILNACIGNKYLPVPGTMLIQFTYQK